MTIKGRGASGNVPNRYAPVTVVPDLAESPTGDDDPPRAPATQIYPEQARSIIAWNKSPDVPFDRSINPYRGCEHGCIYCFARPTHAYLDWSPGLDFETRLVVKVNAAERLRAELDRPGYRCAVLTLGANTDPYQPIERDHRLSRQVLETLLAYGHPCCIITKSQLILDDLPLLKQMAQRNLVRVMVSVTTLDDDLKRRLEPRTASGRARINVIRQLAAAGVPVGVMAAPMIPVINDSELEDILQAARTAGADQAGYVLVRLPLEVAPLFETWLAEHFPQRAAHVMSIIRQSRGGLRNDSRFGSRMRGQGVFADLLAQRFRRACRKFEFNDRAFSLDCSQFRRPGEQTQFDLFGG